MSIIKKKVSEYMTPASLPCFEAVQIRKCLKGNPRTYPDIQKSQLRNRKLIKGRKRRVVWNTHFSEWGSLTVQVTKALELRPVLFGSHRCLTNSPELPGLLSRERKADRWVSLHWVKLQSWKIS